MNSNQQTPWKTFPEIFKAHAATLGADTDSIREKDYGIWQSHSWKGAWEQVREFAHGLAALGFKRGERLAIVGENRPQLYWGMLAAQCLGGVPVPLYQDSIEREMAFIVQHSEARFALTEDQEQTDKLLNIQGECPGLEKIVYNDPRGMRNYDQSHLSGFAQVRELGRQFEKDHPGWLEAEIEKGRGEDLAVICYTSGTTGRPKGVMLTNSNFISTSANIMAFEGLHDEAVLAYLPMAWVGDFFLSFGLSVYGGFTVHCPESSETVISDLREVGPTIFFAPPRIWENLLTSVMIRMDDAAWIKRKVFHYFIELATAQQKRLSAGVTPGLLEKLLYQVGRLLIYSPLRDQMGLRRVRTAYTAGEAIGPEIFEFFRSLGINLKQLYGSTEASVFIALQKNREVRSDTCGPPLPWIDLKITDSGEVLFKGPGLFKGYFKDEEATKEAFEDGYFKTGDAGILDHDGHLKIIDRVKDVTRLQNGTLFAPKYLENKLKFSPYIKEAVAVGQEKPFVSAMLNIDMEAVGNWAEKRNLSYSSYTDLAQNPLVYDLLANEVSRVNKSLGEDSALRDTQIQRFLILHKELDPDDEEITRTRKVRRRFIAEKYQDLIEALYSDASHVSTEAKVTFEDGRSAVISADLNIRDMGQLN